MTNTTNPAGNLFLTEDDLTAEAQKTDQLESLATQYEDLAAAATEGYAALEAEDPTEEN